MWSGTFTGPVTAVVSATRWPTSVLPPVKPAMPAADTEILTARLAVRHLLLFSDTNF